MWELDYKESWGLKNWCFWTVVLEKTLESSLDHKEIQSVNPKGNQSWAIIGRTDAKAETLMLWPPHVKSWLIGKDPDTGKDWWQEENGTTEDDMVGWHHRLNGHEFEKTLGVGDGQGGLTCCSPWGCKESETTEWLNLTELGQALLEDQISEEVNNTLNLVIKSFVFFFLTFSRVLCVLIAQLCLTLCYPMDCSSLWSSVHGILQARILEWVAISLCSVSRVLTNHKLRIN